MKKVYTLFFIIFALFFLIHPRVSSYFPWHYTQFRQDFLDEIVKTKEVNPQTYWKFREFYSIGNFSFDTKVITFGETQKIYALPNDQNTLLTYTSPRLNSVDYIVKTNPAQPQQLAMIALVKEHTQKNGQAEIIFSDDSTSVLKTTEGKYLVIFAKTIEEMKTVNGFFDYVGSEQKLLENTVWLNITTFW